MPAHAPAKLSDHIRTMRRTCHLNAGVGGSPQPENEDANGLSDGCSCASSERDAPANAADRERGRVPMPTIPGYGEGKGRPQELCTHRAAATVTADSPFASCGGSNRG